MLFTHGGGFNSMNRYILSTPFFFLFLRESVSFRFKAWEVVFCIAFGVLYYLAGWHMGIGAGRIVTFIAMLTLTCLLLFITRSRTLYSTFLLVVFALAAIYIQGVLWSRFVTNVWVG
jgi:hypothetical protein